MDETRRQGEQPSAGLAGAADAVTQPVAEAATLRREPAGTDKVEAVSGSSDSGKLQWPPPDDELDGWEVISLAAQAKARQAAVVPFGEVEVHDKPEPAPVVGARTGRVADDAAPPNETTAERLKRLVAATAPAEFTEDEPTDEPRKAAEFTPPAPDAYAPPVLPPAQVNAEPRFGVPTRAVPLALILGIAAGAAAGWFGRPMLTRATTTGALLVETVPPGATVAVDGTARGKTPLRLDLPPGERRLVVESNGLKREATVRLAAGSDVARYFEFGSGVSSDQSAPGSLQVETRPAGARVVIAGEARGTTPVTITGLAPGLHDVVLSSADRTVTQRVEIQAGRESVLVVPMGVTAAAQSGWVAVRSPIPLRILEAGSVVGTTEVRRIMLPAGRHDLELVNERLEVRLARTIAIQGGQELSLDVALPQGRLSVNAQPWAEVFVGGGRLGETPIANASLPVGDHEIVFRHPQLGERRQTVTVRANTPTRVAVSFTP